MMLFVFVVAIAGCRNAPQSEPDPSSPVLRVDQAERRALVAIVGALDESFTRDLAPMCLAIADSARSFEPDNDVLRSAQTAAYPRRILRLRECPRTYTSMIAYPDQATAPLGYIDPHIVTLPRIPAWTDSVGSKVEARQGTSTLGFRCTIYRFRRDLRVHCSIATMMIE